MTATVGLDLGHGEFPKVKDRGGEGGIGLALCETLQHMLGRTDPASKADNIFGFFGEFKIVPEKAF